MPLKTLTHMVTYSVPAVPIQPPSELPPVSSLDERTQGAIQVMRGLFDQRPIWTRRALINVCHDIPESVIKPVFQYSGYMFRSGPWREAIIRFGIDPRTDRKYRVYQTLMFHMAPFDPPQAGSGAGDGGGAGGTSTAQNDMARNPKNKNIKNNQKKRVKSTRWDEDRTRYRRTARGKERHRHSHVFDGQKVTLDGKVWQVCDITDPLIKRLLETDRLRDDCDVMNPQKASLYLIPRSSLRNYMMTNVDGIEVFCFQLRAKFNRSHQTDGIPMVFGPK